MKLNKTQIDDSNWSTAEIAKLYRAAAKYAGYNDEDISMFNETEDKSTMMKRLNSLRSVGWIDVSKISKIGERLQVKTIEFSSLEELSLKLAIRGVF